MLFVHGLWNRLLRKGLGCPESYGVDVWGVWGETPRNHVENIHGGLGNNRYKKLTGSFF